MIVSLALTAVLWPSSLQEHCLLTENTATVGYAQNSRGDFLYCESINQLSENEFHIDYVRNKHAFATKELIYSSNLSLPKVVQFDLRSAERREASIDNTDVLLTYQANRTKKISTAKIKRADIDVIDAGFDNFIRAHWSELKDGTLVNFNFASMTQLRTLPLRLKSTPDENCVDKRDDDSQHSFCFVVEIDNALLRFLFSNMKLTYDNDRRLHTYRGPVNIQDDGENTQNATIYYYYKNDYLINQ